MPRPTLPIVEAFNIPALGWRFVDSREVGPRAELLIKGRWLRRASEWLRSQRIEPQEVICGIDPLESERITALYHAALEAEPALAWPDFEARGGAITSEMEADPRKPEVFLGIRSANRWIGGLSIANVDVERRTPDSIEVSAFLFLGVPRGEGLTMPQTWRVVYRYLMRRGLSLRDGKSLEIMQFDFASSDDVRRRHADHADITDFLGKMAEDFDVRGDPTNRTAAVKFRRRAAR